MAKFTGVWGVFENLDEMTDTIEEVRAREYVLPHFLHVQGMKLIMLSDHNSLLFHG